MKKPTTWKDAYRAWAEWSKSKEPDMTIAQLMSINARLGKRGLCKADRERAIGFICCYITAPARRKSK